MAEGAASECGGTGRREAKPIAASGKSGWFRDRRPLPRCGSNAAKSAKTGVLRRYIFYEMQSDQAVKAIQFVNCIFRLLLPIFAIPALWEKACAAAARRRTIAFDLPRRSARTRVRAPSPNLELRGGFRGHLRAAPRRRVGAVAPAARAIERVHADLVELVHGAHPPRTHPIGVVMRRLADLRQPQPAVERGDGDALGTLHRLGLVNSLCLAVARDGELASEMAVRVLIDEAADIVGIITRENTDHTD